MTICCYSLMLIPHTVVITSMHGNVCACNITKCLSEHACSISTTLQPYIHQHDCGVYDHGIDSTVNCIPMRYFEKSCPSHPDGSPHYIKFLWIFNMWESSRCHLWLSIFFLLLFTSLYCEKRTLHELQFSDQGMLAFHSTKYYNWYHYMRIMSLPSNSDILTGFSSYQEATPVQLFSGSWWYTLSLCG